MKLLFLFSLILITCLSFGAELSLAGGGRYVGDVKNNMADGKGTTFYKNGTRAEGDYINGVFIRGTVSLPDGNVEKGEFKNGRLYKGLKTINCEWEFDYSAEGEFDGNGNLIKGKLTYSDGTVEEGVFKDGYLTEGKITYPTGVTEEGEFQGDMLVHGKSAWGLGLGTDTSEHNM